MGESRTERIHRPEKQTGYFIQPVFFRFYAYFRIFVR